MNDNSIQDRHYIGSFTLDNEILGGEIIYSRSAGNIALHLEKRLEENALWGKRYGHYDSIYGTLNSGATVTLFDCRCVSDRASLGTSQSVIFSCKHAIMSAEACTENSFNTLVCVVDNAIEWSGLSPIVIENHRKFVLQPCCNRKTFNWFNAEISFSSAVINWPGIPLKEDIDIRQRLVIEISKEEKTPIEDFLSIRDKIISMISFAVKDNINVEEQYLHKSDKYNEYGKEYKDYIKYHLITEEAHRTTQGLYRWEYNFRLPQIEKVDNAGEIFEKLMPVFNLYSSLFKYEDMPLEMVFLNMVQAVETFHSRFFYDNSKEKYIQSVKERFEGSQHYEDIAKLLLNDTQMDKNCKYIILVSRINDLLIGKYDGLFYDYFITDDQYGQKIADTRHYYTHYDKAKEKKAFKGRDLVKAINVLALLLEYHICLVLGISCVRIMV